jgi:hypothetical protein
MQSTLKLWIIVPAAVLALSPAGWAQAAPASAAAPPHDIAGVWTAARGLIGNTGNEASPMTPSGQEQFDANKPGYGPRAVPVALDNDPMKYCDPLGFPRNIVWEMRAMEFVQTPAKVVQLFQYQRVWREIWTDGRPLPKNVGGSAADAPDPRYYGYSVGRWTSPDTFVVDTVGTDERTWLDGYGHPHSGDLRVEETYHRVNRDTLYLKVTIDDPKMYTKPFVILPNLELKLQSKMPLPEQLCIPSEADNYMKILGNPASGITGK